MRVNPNPLPDLLLALSRTQQQINTDLEQTASGSSVNVPSDNPAAASMLVRNAAQSSEADQFLRSIASVSGELQNADSALSSVVSALRRAMTLGIQGANGTNNSSDRAALATEVQGIQSQLMSLANLSYQGKFVFAGTDTQDSPYVSDSTSSSGVRYAGNANTNTITVGDNLSVKSNMAGSQLFSGSGTDMFQAVQDLITNLQSGTNIDSAVNEVNDAYRHINGQRVFYGNVVNQLSSEQTYLNNQKTQLAEQQNTLGGADLSKVLSDLVNAETSHQATLEAIGQTQSSNLFDYIK